MQYGLNEDTYEQILNDCSNKINGTSDLEWQEICDKYNMDIHYDTLRKAQQTIFGGAFIKQYFENKKTTVSTTNLDEKILELRKERIKIQTANIERNRIDRAVARREMYYEQIGQACISLPLPEFKPIIHNSVSTSKEYLVCLSDLHYGATFTSLNNKYSPLIFKERLEYLLSELIEFVQEKELSKIHIACLGDTLQGILRVSDLKLNDTSVVKAAVEISRYIANFLSALSAYVNIEYYHVPFANHTQIRPLGTKAGEISDEDLEYVIGHYIKDLCSNNNRIKISLAEENQFYIDINITSFQVRAMHGHHIKNVETALKELNSITMFDTDYLILGHYHTGKEIPVSESVTYDTEVLVCPSFVGSDPYSDSIFKGSKGAVKIYGFDEIYGHTESYKIILS